MNKKILKKGLWGGLSVGLASLFVVITGGYQIAMSQSGTVNKELNINTSVVDYSDDEAYDYFGGNYQKGEYTGDYNEVKKEFNRVAKQVEAEGLVLLRNKDNTLPLAKGATVSPVLGGSVNFNYSTSGSGGSSSAGLLNLKQALEQAELKVNEDVWNYYKTVSQRTATKINDAPFDKMSDTVKASLNGTTAVAVISRSAGEGSDMPSARSDGHDESYLSLSQNELSVLQGLTQLKKEGKLEKLVVILNSAATVQLDFLDGVTITVEEEKKDEDGKVIKDEDGDPVVEIKEVTYEIDVDACLWVGNVGSIGIEAVAETLAGKNVPSGKLSDTYLKDNFASPAGMQLTYNSADSERLKRKFSQMYEDYQSYNLTESTMYYGVYTEGIYVGYRYFETRYYDYVTAADERNTGEYDYNADVAYPFGYGQSYTTFAYSDMTVTPAEDGQSYDISVTVTNTGTEFSGKESVQVYLQKPYTEYDIEHGVEKSAVELVGYDKTTEELAPGDHETLTINVPKSAFKSYDSNNAKTYILENGDYYFAVGNGAHDAVNNILALQKSEGLTVDEKKMDAAGDKGLAKKVSVTHSGETFGIEPTKDAGKKLALSTHENADGEYAEITNVIDNADLNKYIGEGTVTYVSRSDWQGTMPKAEVVINAKDVAEGLKSNNPIEEDPEAVMPEYDKDNGLTLAMLRDKEYNDEQWEELLDQLSFAEQTLMVTRGYYQTEVTPSVALPSTKASDGPTGIGTSKGGLSFPSEGIWASTLNDDLIVELGEVYAEESLANGIQNIYAPGVNIHRMAFGGRCHEYFSEDPYLSGMMAAKEINGLQSKGVVATVKHYVFNDEEDQRAGISIWLNEQEAREIMLTAFEYALTPDYGDAGSVMNSFNRAGATWVGAHSDLMDVMRSEWGFNGFCITDMAVGPAQSYMTHQDGIPAGTNLYMGSNEDEALFKQFSNSATFCSALRESCHRILYTVCNYSAAMNNIGPESTVGASVWWWSVTLIAVDCVVGVALAGCAVMWTLSAINKSKSIADAAA